MTNASSTNPTPSTTLHRARTRANGMPKRGTAEQALYELPTGSVVTAVINGQSVTFDKTEPTRSGRCWVSRLSGGATSNKVLSTYPHQIQHVPEQDSDSNAA